MLNLVLNKCGYWKETELCCDFILFFSKTIQTGEKSRDDALEAIKGNLDGFSRDAKMHPTPASHPKKPGLSFSSLPTENKTNIWNPWQKEPTERSVFIWWCKVDVLMFCKLECHPNNCSHTWCEILDFSFHWKTWWSLKENVIWNAYHEISGELIMDVKPSVNNFLYTSILTLIIEFLSSQSNN